MSTTTTEFDVLAAANGVAEAAYRLDTAKNDLLERAVRLADRADEEIPGFSFTSAHDVSSRARLIVESFHNNDFDSEDLLEQAQELLDFVQWMQSRKAGA